MCHRGCFREDIYKKYVLCKKEEKKNDNKGIKEIKKFLLEYYILNLENIIRKMNKMILEIFMNKTRVRCLDFFLFFFFN